jgi:O-antigen/teichoic acid export membrane protein
MLNDSKQYLITALVLIAYQQIDKLFIVQLIDIRTVGWYGTAMNLFGTLMFVPVVIGTVIFPTLSRNYVSDKAVLNKIAQRGLDLMFLIGVPVGLGLLIISKPLINLLYGAEFAPSGPILGMLGIVLIFTYLNTFLGQLLISTDRTGPWNMVMLAGVVLTAPLDLILVPWTHTTFGNGALGGATAFLFTEAGMVIGAVMLMPKGMLLWANVRTAALCLCCGLVMLATSWWWRDTMMPLSILVGAITYISLIFLLRVVPHDDLLVLKDVGMLVIGKLRRFREAPASTGN